MPHLILRTFHTTFCVHVPHRILRHMPHAGSPSMPFLGGGHTTPGLEPATPFPPGRTTPPVYRRSFFFFAGIEREQLETAVGACYDNGTMYCQRMQIYEGSLYLTDYRAIFFDRHYAPARILPLLETLRRNPVF